MMSDPLTLRDEGRFETYHMSYNRLGGGVGEGVRNQSALFMITCPNAKK